MNKEIARIIAVKLSDLQFIDVLAGLVQVVPMTQPDENNNPKRIVFPVAYEIIKPVPDECSPGIRDLVPDSSKKSIIYFEDLGIGITGGGSPGRTAFLSTVRLVGWFNRERLTGDQFQNISTTVISRITNRLVGRNPLNSGNIRRLTFSVARIPPQDASLFSRYTYDETIRQYLMPPFECLGIDISCRFMVNDACITDLNLQGGAVC